MAQVAAGRSAVPWVEGRRVGPIGGGDQARANPQPDLLRWRRDGPAGCPALAVLFVAAILLGFPAVSSGLLPVVAAPVLLIWGGEGMCFGTVAGYPAADRAGL